MEFYNDRVLDSIAKLNSKICKGKFGNLPIVIGHDIHERRDWIEQIGSGSVGIKLKVFEY